MKKFYGILAALLLSVLYPGLSLLCWLLERSEDEGDEWAERHEKNQL